MITPTTEFDKTNPVYYNNHTAWIQQNGELIIEPSASTSDYDNHNENMKMFLGLDQDQLTIGWRYTFKRTNKKVYHWNNWLPDFSNGTKSKTALDADGPRAILIGSKK